MEPRIQYAKTKDGVSIAFWALGEGMPLVGMSPLPISHIQLEWQVPEYRRWYERLAKNRKLVRYDGRGLGLSERNVTDFSLDAQVLDLEAVVDRLDLKEFALFAALGSGAAGIAYAVRYPKRVSDLILWCSSTAGVFDPSGSPDEYRWERPLMESNWDLYTETAAHHYVGWSEAESAHRMAQLMRDSITWEQARALSAMWPSLDVTALLPEVKSPTLVLHRRQIAAPNLENAKALATHIPDARLVVLEGESVAPFLGDVESVLKTIDEFLGLEEVAEAAVGGAFRTVLFTDVEGSTALTQRLGDAKARDLLRQHERLVREALKAHGGSELKTMGDGFMASFSSATRALECSIAMQRAFAAHNQSAEEPILVRVGMNAGEPIAEEADLYGTAVNLAARICGHAQAGQILASDVVRQLVAGKDFLFADRGEVALRGFDEPVRLYEVRWQE
jgi:class 3 adenylate cyclase